MKKHALYLVVLMLLSLAGTASAQDSVMLKLKYHLGDELRYQLKNSSLYTMEIDGVSELQGKQLPGGSMDQEFVLNQKVTDISPDNITTIEFKYESCSMRMFAGGNEVPGIENAMQKMVGQTMIMKVDSQGKVVDFIAAENFPPEMAKTDMRQFLKQVQPNIPQREVKIGEQWIDENAFKVPVNNGIIMDMKIKSVNKLLGIETFNGQPCAKIDVKFYISYLQHGTSTPDAQDSNLGKGEGKGEFISYFNIDQGRYENTNGKVKLNIKVFLDTGANEAKKIVMRMQMLQTMDMQLLPPLAPEITPSPAPAAPSEAAPAPDLTPAPQTSPGTETPVVPAPEIKSSPVEPPAPGSCPAPAPSPAPQKDEPL